MTDEAAEDDDRHLRRRALLTDALEEGDSVGVGEGEVEDDEVRRSASEGREGLASRTSCDDLRRQSAEGCGDEGVDVLVVVDDEDERRASCEARHR